MAETTRVSHHPHPRAGSTERGAGVARSYAKLAASLGASLVVMYLLAFSQLSAPGHFHLSLSVFWISLSMVAAMGLIMVMAMGRMLPDRRVNVSLMVLFALLLAGAFAAGRSEALVGDDAFLGSMIPHHSRAIHMCEQAQLQDSEVVRLCRQIVAAQREEIVQMEGIIARRG